MPLITLNRVVLPAPFGPITPWIWPGATSSVMPSSTVRPPKRLVSASTARIGALTTGRRVRSRRRRAPERPRDQPSPAPLEAQALSQGGSWNSALACSSGQITWASPFMSWTMGKKNPFMNSPVITSPGASAVGPGSRANW